MSDNLIERLRDHERHAVHDSDDDCLAAAAALEAMQKEVERLEARNEHLEKRFGYLEGDWERRNHIIETQAARVAELEIVVEIAKRHIKICPVHTGGNPNELAQVLKGDNDE